MNEKNGLEENINTYSGARKHTKEAMLPATFTRK